MGRGYNDWLDFGGGKVDAGWTVFAEVYLGEVCAKLRNRVLVPRALAVISCALALLAAQPVVAGGVEGPRAAVVARAEGVKVLGVVQEKRVVRAAEEVRREETFFAARRLHILATVEIFKRLLLAELSAGERGLEQAFILEPVGVVLTEVPVRLGVGRVAEARSLSPPERMFAIEHCLSAPPIV